MLCNILTPLLALWRKESLALLRDKHGLAALFVMPAVFILVMSLALQDSLKPSAVKLGYAIVDLDQTPSSRAFTERLHRQLTLQDRGLLGDEDAARAALQAHRAEQRVSFVLVIPKGYAKVKDTPHLRLLADAGAPGSVEIALRQQVLATLLTQRVQDVLERLKGTPLEEYVKDVNVDQSPPLDTVAVNASARGLQALPSAVQQSVPAWLIFSMFFVVVPMSAIFITERQQGTLQRLRAMRTPYGLLLAGKLLPFLFINQIQALLMLAVGRWLVPALGGSALTLPDAPEQIAGLVVISLSVSVAAVCWALLIASLVGTSEQATVIGGIGNILMGAIGGIMAPKFLMPTAMQKLADISPMSWALDGFHEVLLRGGGAAAVAPEAGALLLFGAVALGAAMLINRRNRS